MYRLTVYMNRRLVKIKSSLRCLSEVEHIRHSAIQWRGIITIRRSYFRNLCSLTFHTYSDRSNPFSKVTPDIVHYLRKISRMYLPLFLEFLGTVAVALATCREPLGLFPGTPGPPDAIYVRILIPLAARFVFKPKLCLSAVI